MSKVYCTNCKYYECGGSYGYSMCRKEIGRGSNWLKKYKETPRSPHEQNKNNDCEYYKKCWWMFWER